ncbi:MAG: hypothetical protein KDA22_11255 [Phycisphaerales bacterium]|nr:hypothetical protein [Phycisphaerales bacterium]
MIRRQPALRRLVAGIAFSLTALAASPASAQFGGQSGFAEAFQPDFLRRDMTIFNQYLELEDWQRPIVEILLEDYNASFRTGVEGVREQMRDMKDQIASSGQRAMEVVMRPIENWMAEKDQLATDMLQNVKGQLSDRQKELWPRFERAMRREKSLHRGELSGESVNIIGVLNQMQLAPDTMNQLRPVIEEYEIQLDNALVYREQVVESAQPKVKDAMVNMDFDAGMSAMDTIMAARIQVRNIQDASAAAIAAAMTPENGAEFTQRYYQAAYSKVFRPSPMERTFEVVHGLEDLTAEQMAEVVELETQYNADYATSSMQILAVLREEEPKDARRKAEAIRARQSGAAPAKREAEPLSDAFAMREALTEPAMERLRQILTAEQFAKLPNNSRARHAAAKDYDPDRLDAAGRGPNSPTGSLKGAGKGDQRDAGERGEKQDEARRNQAKNKGRNFSPPGVGRGASGGSKDRGGQPKRSSD